MRNWNLHLVEQAFAEAATNFDAWGSALGILAEQTGSHGALLFNAAGKPFPSLPMSDRMGEPSENYFRDGWHLRDERFRGLPVMMRNGVFDDFDIMDGDAIKRHPYYQEFLAKNGLFGFVGIKMAAGEEIWCVSLQRAKSAELFSRAEKQELASLSDSLSSAAAVSRALGYAASDAALEAFEIAGTAVLLVNERGEVVRANGAAERLLNNGSSVRIARKQLAAADSDSTAALDRALHRLLWMRTGSALAPPVPLLRDGASPLLAYPLKLAKLTANPFSEGRAMIVLIDPDRRDHPPEEALRNVFKLTHAEARVAARLASGAELNDVSDELGIAKETGRHHLKSIFAKTGARRQAELVMLFAGMLSRTNDNRSPR
jgi:DNA-binding CsgD family transcriptional regulator